jgi:hypothetical protein
MTMDLTSYSGLKSAIADFANRSDLTNQIPGFIVLAEADIKMDLRTRSVRTSFTIASAAQTLPNAVQSLRSVRLVTSDPSQDANLVICTPQTLTDHRTNWISAGRPHYAALIGSELNVVPAPDQSYTAEIVYVPALTPLSDANTTNEVLVEAPTAYLYGSLVAASGFLDESLDTVAKWQKLYDTAIAKLNVKRDREEFGAAPFQARLPVVF